MKRYICAAMLLIALPVYAQDTTTNINTTATSNAVSTSTSTNTNNNNNVNATTYTGTSTNSNTNTNNNTNVSISTSTNTNNNTSVNQNTNNSTSVNQNTNNSTSVNTSTSENTSFQTTNSVSDITAMNQNSNVNTNTNNSTSDSSQRVTQKIESPPPSAIAPSIGASYSQDLCTTGISGAVQTQILGFSAGKSVRDTNCERIKLSKTMYDMGMRVAAVSLMCQDYRVWSSMMSAGTPCPYDGKIGDEAKALWEANPERVPTPDKRLK